ncbi:MAG: hypothetical protein C0609_07305 [Deltaproteobacteria bacterium]|nr:MAG: hypothetical protein C0609_07305 [Deltaproteobacteria bacterium]
MSWRLPPALRFNMIKVRPNFCGGNALYFPFPKKDAVATLEALAGPSEAARGRALQQGGAVNSASLRGGGEESFIEGNVEDGGKRFRPTLFAEGDRLTALCTCEGVQPCRHAVALSRHWARIPESRYRVTGGWKNLLERLAPRKPYAIAREGEPTLVHYLYIRESEGAFSELSISWRVHKPRGNSLGRGRSHSAFRLLEGEVARLGVSDRRVLGRAVAFSPSGGTDRLPIDLPSGEISSLLGALSLCDHVRWEATSERVIFEPVPAIVHISAKEAGKDIKLSCTLSTPDGRELKGEKRVLSSASPWLLHGGVLREVYGAADGLALATLMDRGVMIPEADLPSFFSNAVSALDSWGVIFDTDFSGALKTGASLSPVPKLYLSEEGGKLVAFLSFNYGDFEVNAENPDPVLVIETGGGRVSLKRDLQEEFAAVKELLDAGLTLTEPGRFEAAGDTALDFLRFGASGLGPGWELFGREELTKHRVTATPLHLRVKLSAGIDWLDLNVEGYGGEESATFASIARALEGGSRYVKLEGGGYAPIPEEWVETLTPLSAGLKVREGVARLPAYRAEVVKGFIEQAKESEVEDSHRWESLVSVLADPEKAGDYPLPKGLSCKLRPYQERGYRWLRFLGERGLGGILADDMGLGKTVQTLALLLDIKERGEGGPNLVVAPTSVVPNWEAEVRSHAPSLTHLRYHGVDRAELRDELEKYDLVVTSYAILRRDAEHLAKVDWCYIILDEAQTIKNGATKTARAARSLSARRRLSLTGTPLENHLGELWSQFRFLMPELLGSERKFAERYLKPISQGDAEAANGLRERVGPFILRRLKPEVAPELPPRIDNVLLSDLGEKQWELYRALLAAGRERVFKTVEEKGFSRSRGCLLDVLTRLRQVCCHPALLPGGVGAGVSSAKFDQFTQFVSEVLEEGHRILVYSQFVEVLKLMHGWFEGEGISHLGLDGRTTNREDVVGRFQEDESVRAFLVSLKAGGTGLNLTAADYVILFDPWWNPAVEEQAIDRAHRIGRERAVFSYKMIAAGTVEEKIQALQQKKRKMTEGFLPTGEGWGGALEEADLEELFKL